MTLILDTSIIIDIERRDEKILSKLKELVENHPSPARITFINYFEFVYGLQQRSPKNKERAMSFIDVFGFIEPTKKTAKILSDLKYKYDKLGKMISLADLMIASQTIENDMLLITRDKQFEQIEELKKIVF